MSAFGGSSTPTIERAACLPSRLPTPNARRGNSPKPLAERGISVWHGNFYALPLTEALGLEPEGLLRIGLMHYNTPEEVDRVLTALGELP